MVGFHPYGPRMYPHLKAVLSGLDPNLSQEYFHFHERGYFSEKIISAPRQLRSWLRFFGGLAVSIWDSLRLSLKIRRFDTVVAIDYFAFGIASALASKQQKVILWSHDIVGEDNPQHSFPLVQPFLRLCRRGLEQRGRLIVQDEAREKLLLRSLSLSRGNIRVFHLPVTLPQLPAADQVPHTISDTSRPKLLQSGGIGAYRVSDRLLAHYQAHSDSYLLQFHGFVFPELRAAIQSAHHKPQVSEEILTAEALPALFRQSDIGFVAYGETDANFFPMSMASGQMVEFLRVGLPVICFGKNDLGAFVEEHGCGCALINFGDLSAVIAKITADYEGYSRRSLATFNKFFRLEVYLPGLSSFIAD